MNERLCEPDTRANVAAWVTYAQSLDEDERFEHTSECEEGGAFNRSTDCPLCNAIAKLNGYTRAERRAPLRRAWLEMTDAECWEVGQRIEHRALEPWAFYSPLERLIINHVNNLIEKAEQSGNAERLIELMAYECRRDNITDMEAYRAFRLKLIQEDISSFKEMLQSTVECLLSMHKEATKYNPLRFSAVADTALNSCVHGEKYYSLLILRTVLAVLITMLSIDRIRLRHVIVLPDICENKARLLLVVSVSIAPRAPQFQPYSGK